MLWQELLGIFLLNLIMLIQTIGVDAAEIAPIVHKKYIGRNNKEILHPEV
jgi:hypothetical protein